MLCTLWYCLFFVLITGCTVRYTYGNAIESDNLLEVLVFYPFQKFNVKSLTIRGNGLGLSWSGPGMPLTMKSDFTFSISLSYPVSSIGTLFEFKVLVDDSIWQIGKNEMVTLKTGPLQIYTYPFFFTSEGSYQYIRDFYSPQLNNNRDLVVYTPPSYNENTYKSNYPVLFMHDGQNLFNDSTSFGGISWRCQDTVNALVAEGQMDEIVIIGIDNTINRTDELTYSFDPSVGAGGNGAAYLDFIEQTVFPFIQSSFRISPSKIGLLGSSLGGLISCYAGWTRTTYSLVGCMSSSFWWNSEDFKNNILNNPPAKRTNNLLPHIYLDSGNTGPDNDDVTQTIAVTQKIENQWQFVIGTNLFYYLDNGGQHSEKYWGARFWVPMADLYPPSSSLVVFQEDRDDSN